MIQQVVYLAIIGGILYVDFVRDAQPDALRMPAWLERLWKYHSLLLHFCLGTLMNLYSIFFLMSASLFSSIVFVVLLLAAVVLNELHAVRRRGLDVKVALYVALHLLLLVADDSDRAASGQPAHVLPVLRGDARRAGPVLRPSAPPHSGTSSSSGAWWRRACG